MSSPSLTGVVAIGALFVLLAVVERVRPLRRRTAPTGRRLLVNAALAGAAFAVAAVAVRPVAERLLSWDASFGLVSLVPMPPLVQAGVAMLLMDLSFYYWHRANHRVPLLWRFHVVHHVDPDLDVTTAVRFHPGELALSAAFRAVQIAAIGVTAGTYLLYELIFQASTYFHHSNLRLPLKLERGLSYLVVTPRMHGIHHSQVEDETHSNYSVVLSCWDRLHRTIRLNVVQARITIGIPALSAARDNRLRSAFGLPLKAQPAYWRGAPKRAEGEVGPHRGRLVG